MGAGVRHYQRKNAGSVYALRYCNGIFRNVSGKVCFERDDEDDGEKINKGSLRGNPEQSGRIAEAIPSIIQEIVPLYGMPYSGTSLTAFARNVIKF